MHSVADAFSQTPHGLFYQLLIESLGSWVANLFGDPSQTAVVKHSLISVMAGEMTEYALIIGVMICSFMLLFRLIAANASGHWGKGADNAWYLVTASLAFMLVFPLPVQSQKTGGGYYSAAQLLVVYGVGIASNGADMLWDKSVDYMMGVPKLRYDKQDVFHTADNTLRALVCAYGVSQSSSGTPFMTAVDETGAHDYSTLNTNAITWANKISWAGGLCGSVTFATEKDKSTDTIDAKIRASYINTFYKRAIPGVQSAYAKLANDLNVQAKVINKTSGLALATASPHSSATDDKNVNTLNQLSIDFATALTHYQNRLAAIPDQINVSSIPNALKTKMHQSGWASAGMYYLELANYQSAFNRLVKNLNESASFRSPPVCGSLYNATGCIAKDFMPDYTQGVDAVTQNATPKLTDQQALGGTAMRASLTRACNTHGCDYGGVTRSFASNIATWFLDKAIWAGDLGTVNRDGHSGSVKDFSGNTNPIWALSAMGHTFTYYATAVYGFGTLANIAEHVLKSENKAVNSSVLGFLGGGVIAGPVIATTATFLSEVVTLCKYLGTYLLMIGFLLGYVIVYWPVIIWTFMVFGYLVLILEAIMAVPLGVVKLTVYEGSGVAGTNFQRLSAMVFAVLFRPILYVMAFNLSIVMMYVGFGLINRFFWSVTSMNSTAGLFETLAAITVYVGLCFAFVKICFGYMHRLPEAVMYWLTGQMYSMFTDGGDPATQAVEKAGQTSGSGLATTALSERRTAHGKPSNSEGG